MPIAVHLEFTDKVMDSELKAKDIHATGRHFHCKERHDNSLYLGFNWADYKSSL